MKPFMCVNIIHVISRALSIFPIQRARNREEGEENTYVVL